MKNMTPAAVSREINMSQAPVKSLQATRSIFHSQEVIKSLDPDLLALKQPAVRQRAAAWNGATWNQPSGSGPQVYQVSARPAARFGAAGARTSTFNALKTQNRRG